MKTIKRLTSTLLALTMMSTFVTMVSADEAYTDNGADYSTYYGDPDATDTWLNDDISLIRGDVNEDGIIDLSDLTKFSQFLLKDIPLDVHINRYDFNYDTEINISDLANLKQYVMGETEVQIEPDYDAVREAEGDLIVNVTSDIDWMLMSTPTKVMEDGTIETLPAAKGADYEHYKYPDEGYRLDAVCIGNNGNFIRTQKMKFQTPEHVMVNSSWTLTYEDENGGLAVGTIHPSSHDEFDRSYYPYWDACMWKESGRPGRSQKDFNGKIYPAAIDTAYKDGIYTGKSSGYYSKCANSRARFDSMTYNFGDSGILETFQAIGDEAPCDMYWDTNEPCWTDNMVNCYVDRLQDEEYLPAVNDRDGWKSLEMFEGVGVKNTLDSVAEHFKNRDFDKVEKIKFESGFHIGYWFTNDFDGSEIYVETEENVYTGKYELGFIEFYQGYATRWLTNPGLWFVEANMHIDSYSPYKVFAPVLSGYAEANFMAEYWANEWSLSTNEWEKKSVDEYKHREFAMTQNLWVIGIGEKPIAKIDPVAFDEDGNEIEPEQEYESRVGIPLVFDEDGNPVLIDDAWNVDGIVVEDWDGIVVEDWEG